MLILAALLIGFALDAILGDPEGLYHPVRTIGLLISRGEKMLRRLLPKREFLAGAILAICVCVLCFAVPFVILWLLGKWSLIPCLILEAIWCWRILAAKCLKDEAFRIRKYLRLQDIENSRKYVGYVVGRDTAELTEEEIIKATVETVAENTSDGVVAPMLYFAIGGAPLAFLYKAVNTMDSMIGYKNEKYLYFGRFAARLDDVFNFIPARITGLLMIVTAPLVGLSGRGAWRIFRRDRYKHLSPNSAQCESAAAGALGVELGGSHKYFGKMVEKPTIGDPERPVDAEDITKTVKLMYAASSAALLLFGAARLALVLTIFN